MLVLAAAPNLANAQPAQITYNATSKMTVGRVGKNPTAMARHFEHAWWQSNDGVFGHASYNPSPQHNGFLSWGFDYLSEGHHINSDMLPDARGNRPKNATKTILLLTEQNAPIPNNTNFKVQAHINPGGPPMNVRAEAVASFKSVPAPAADAAAYEAEFGTSGYVTKIDGVKTFAASVADVTFRDTVPAMGMATVRNGRSGAWGRVGSEVPAASRGWGPIAVALLDNAGNPLFQDVVVSTFCATDGDASVVWADDGAIALDASDGGTAALHISINENYVAPGQGGTLDLEITDGIVTESAVTGAFEGYESLLPELNEAVGAWSGLSIPYIEVDLMLGDYITPEAYWLDLNMSDVTMSFVPEPGSLVLLLLGGACGLMRKRIV
jgi:hypothetical protein